jgi:alanine dehydrogenase
MNAPFQPEHTLEPQLSPIGIDTNNVRATIGMLSSETLFEPLMLSLKQIEELVDDRVAVLIQRGLGVEHNISDYQFTEYGADIMEDELPIIALSTIVLKYASFSIEDIFFLKEKQVIISTAPPEAFTNEMVQFLQEKKITAVGINFLNLENYQIQDIVWQLVSTLLFSRNLQHSIQLNPMFLKSVYCYNGEICNRTIAENAGVPWKDLVELCWNWN